MPLEGESTPKSPSAPSSPRETQARRPPATRACDRCRQRKAKCDFDTSNGTCSLCGNKGERCAFDLPLSKRGPKAKPRDGRGIPRLISPAVASPATPPPRLSPPSATVSHQTPSLGPPRPVLRPSWDSSWAGSPEQSSTPAGFPFVPSPTAATSLSSSILRWNDLSRLLSIQGINIASIVRRCFDLFFEYLYPLTPLVHEPSLRAALEYFTVQRSTHHATNTGRGGRDPEAWADFTKRTNARTTSSSLDKSPDATFTLITAVCAETSFMLPKHLFPEGDGISSAFLQASRDCLLAYLEADLEDPNANSITTRYFHSNCVHAAGRPKYSWHIYGEAIRLAQVMRLHDETSLQGLPTIEAELRRRVFWIVYMGDKSAAILNNRPVTIHRLSFEGGITTAYPKSINPDAYAIFPNEHVPSPQRSASGGFIAGFNANLRLWEAAWDLLLETRLLQDRQHSDPSRSSLPTGPPSAEDRQGIESLYIRFITSLDDLPPHLQTYHPAAANQEATEDAQYAIQCANLQVSLHCLRMVITRKLEDVSFSASGLEQADIRETEIARDMLRAMYEAPFWALQVNGEPLAEKIRLVGASLLAVIHRNRDSPLAARARTDFTSLLDFLTRLDSKASDALRSNSTWVM